MVGHSVDVDVVVVVCLLFVVDVYRGSRSVLFTCRREDFFAVDYNEQFHDSSSSFEEWTSEEKNGRWYKLLPKITTNLIIDHTQVVFVYS